MDNLLAHLGSWLVQADVGLGMLLLVGLSMSLSHVFALLANRLNARQLLWHVLLDGLVLSLAFVVNCFIDMLLLSLYASKTVHPSVFLNGTAVCLLPVLFYFFVAAPYVGDLIALAIWLMVHLNVITLLHARFGLPYAEALLLSTPGFLLALWLIWIEFRQSWRQSYSKLASELDS
ncbi:hypothetical protein KBY58_07650 [Cyanobium sp. HWJ4-Hawea]|nr:hypothetical protein [Cyanobium sp. HWJ4-Hawea]